MKTHLLAVLLLAFTVVAPSHAQPHPADSIPPSTLPGLEHAEDFFPGAPHDPAVPTPDSVLGFQLGSRPANHAQIQAVIRAIADKSPRVKLFDYGATHEGRVLTYAVIATPERLARLDELKADLAKLDDPRAASAADADRLADSMPAVAWMAYVIHGDEMSGSDASLAALYHLAAGQGDDVKRLLDNLVIIIDPLMNPDGRDRWITGIAQERTRQPQVDDQSLLHAGRWPSGRMNHYLFDMNRDWIFGTQPETRGRIAAIRQWRPHYFMESHEMGSQDTFLFMPPREPVNHNYPPFVREWETRFANDLGKAFDARGWRYYTGEWNEGWYPGYSSSWAALRGCVENLYEQAAISIDAVRRPEGTLEPYRESVHKQLVASLANLDTLARNRAQILKDYVADRRAVLADNSPYAARTFAIVPGANASRLRQFCDLLDLQGFEVYSAPQEFAAAATDRLGREEKDRKFPAGTLLVPARQPLARLIAAMLEFDPRMSADFLTVERRELLRFDRSKLYDITGWSIPMLFDVDCYTLASDLPAGAQRLNPSVAPAAPAVDNDATTIAFLLNGADDRSVSAAARLMERGVWCRVAAKPLEFAGAKYPRGSVLITRKDNPGPAANLNTIVAEVCRDTQISAVGLTTGMGPGDAPDLGGENFVLLHPPRIAVVGAEGVSPYSFGSAWHTLDRLYGVRANYVSLENLSQLDLRRYNVLVIPETSSARLADSVPAIKSWVEGGGTLIALGESVRAFASEKGIGSVRLLDDVLTKPEPYIQAIIREFQGLTTAAAGDIGYARSAPTGDAAVEFPWDGAVSDKPSDDELKRRDEWRRIFMPQGAILAARADDRSWLTSGRDDYIPVIVAHDPVLAATAGLAPARLGVFLPLPPEAAKAAAAAEKKKDDAKSDKDKSDDDDKPKKPKPGWAVAPPGQELRLRMSGLLWPEAAERLANAPYVTRESVGAGQVILFSGDPNFRGAALGSARLFVNAAVYGPGMGANQPIKP